MPKGCRALQLYLFFARALFFPGVFLHETRKCCICKIARSAHASSYCWRSSPVTPLTRPLPQLISSKPWRCFLDHDLESGESKKKRFLGRGLQAGTFPKAINMGQEKYQKVQEHMNVSHFFLQRQALEMISSKTSSSAVCPRPFPLCAVPGTWQGKVPQWWNRVYGKGGFSNAHVFTECAWVACSNVSLSWYSCPVILTIIL